MSTVTSWLATSLLLGSLVAGCAGTGADAAAGLDPTAVRPPGIDLSDEEIRSAVAVALADDRLAPLLDVQPHEVEEVRRAAAQDTGVVVIVGFAGPVADAEYPLDVCAIDRGDPPAAITGVVWLVVDDEVAAVSPRWGQDLACGY